MAKLLIVEDDVQTASLVADSLSFNHYEVEQVHEGREALERLLSYKYDLVILDWELPSISGVEICNELRKRNNDTPILMLTAKTDITDKVTGFDTGVDDYLTKPFSVRELLARVRALLKRSSGLVDNCLVRGPIVLDPTTFRVRNNDVDIELTRREFALLEFFMRHPNQVFTAEDLLDRVWASETDAYIKAVRTAVSRLKGKLQVKGHGAVIQNVYGIGYKFDL